MKTVEILSIEKSLENLNLPVKLLFCRYPSLRVAYVEEKEEMADRPCKVYSSVLVKAVNGFDQVPTFICAGVE